MKSHWRLVQDSAFIMSKLNAQPPAVFICYPAFGIITVRDNKPDSPLLYSIFEPYFSPDESMKSFTVRSNILTH